MIVTSGIISGLVPPGYNIDTAESGRLYIQSDCVSSYARQMVACFNVQHSSFIATYQTLKFCAKDLSQHSHVTSAP